MKQFKVIKTDGGVYTVDASRMSPENGKYIFYANDEVVRVFEAAEVKDVSINENLNEDSKWQMICS